MLKTKPPSGPKSIGQASKYQRYRRKQKARGLREVRMWVVDTSAPGFREDLERQIKILNAAPEGREALDFIEASAAHLSGEGIPAFRMPGGAGRDPVS